MKRFPLIIQCSKTCGQSFKHFTLVNYDSRVKICSNFNVRFDSRVVIYDHKMFIRLATGGILFMAENTRHWGKDHCTAGLQYNKT